MARPFRSQQHPRHSRAVIEIAKIEGPVHIDLVRQRLRDAWGIGRVGHKIRDNIDLAIHLAKNAGQD